MSTAAPCSLHPMETQPCSICTTGIRAVPAPDFAPPADLIDDLCARLWKHARSHSTGLAREAADALQRLRAENAANVDAYAAQVERAERAEAERDTLAGIVRAADAMRHAHGSLTWETCECSACSVIRAYDAARAKWEGK